MLKTTLDFIVHNMLLRELFIGFLMLLVVLRYIIRYMRASRNNNVRIRNRKMATTVKDTRILLILLLVILLGVIGFDRVLPHFVNQPITSHKVATKKSVPAKTSSKKKTTSTSKTKAAVVSGVLTAADATTVPDGAMDADKATAIVAHYFANNPDEDGAADAYKCTTEGKGDADVAMYKVTGYAKDANGKLTADHMYWVYANGKFTTKY